MNIPMKYEDVVAKLDAALAEVDRLKNIDHRQILAESAAKYLLDSGAENFIGDVFTIEADDGLVKFEVIVTTQKAGAKSPGEICKDLQQRLTVAEQREVELEGLLREVASLDPRGEFLGWQLDGKIDAALKPAAEAPGSTCNQIREESGLPTKNPCVACNNGACIDR